MAGLSCAFSPGAITLTTGTPRTVLQILAPTNQRIQLVSFALSFVGNTAGYPVVIRLLKQTSAGTMTTGTPVLLLPGSETPQAGIFHSATGTEPTASDVYEDWTCQPTGNLLIPLSILVPGGGRVGLECNSPVGVNVRPTLKWWE